MIKKRQLTIAGIIVFIGLVLSIGLIISISAQTPPPSHSITLCTDPCAGRQYFAYYNSTSGVILAGLGCQPDPTHGAVCPQPVSPGQSVLNITSYPDAVKVLHNMCAYHVDVSSKSLVLNPGYISSSLPTDSTVCKSSAASSSAAASSSSSPNATNT